MGVFNFKTKISKQSNTTNTEFLRTQIIEFHSGLTQNGKYEKKIDDEGRNINGEKYILKRSVLPTNNVLKPIVKELIIWPESDSNKEDRCVAITNNLESLVCALRIDFNRLDTDEKYIDELFNQLEDMIFKSQNTISKGKSQFNQQEEQQSIRHH